MTNISNPEETNCMMTCMTESTCIGYAWNLNDDGKCRLYSKMVTGTESVGANESVSWACSTDGSSSGVSCDWTDVLNSTHQDFGSSNDNVRIEFRPDPSCPAFSNCTGELVPTN